jgi:hypothetical protein
MKEHPEIKVEYRPAPAASTYKIQTMAPRRLGDLTWSTDVWTTTPHGKLGIIAWPTITSTSWQKKDECCQLRGIRHP